MTRLQALLTDRKRAQRGSVLSGVLIIVAFLSIIAGALMTELSTSLLISRALVHRVSNQATVNSAVALALDQLQHEPLVNRCPDLKAANLPSGTAVASYVSCALVVDAGAPQQFQRTLMPFPFNVDGTRAVLPTQGRDDYLVGDAGGNVYDYGFGLSGKSMKQLWKKSLGDSVTGPPMEMPDTNNQPLGVLVLVPISSTNPGCGSANFCVASIAGGVGDGDSDDQTLQCFMAASASVTARPAAGVRNDDLVYFGDGKGQLLAFDTDNGGCAPADGRNSVPIAGGRAVVAGPVVFPGPSGTDELYLVVSDATSSQLVHYTYQQSPGLSFISSLALPAPQTKGIALEPGTLPSRLAITFAGGQVALAQIQADFGVSLLTSANVPTKIDHAPYWCQCPGGDLIAVGGRDGGLYVFDTSFNPNATYPAGGPAITTTPVGDAAGDWFFGASDGMLHEVQRQAGQTTLVLAASPYGSGSTAISSSPMLGSCNITWICIYAGSADSIYLVPLDARHVVVTACVSTPCANPRLWASVEVGSTSSPTTVHVRGWSYYSP